MPRPDMVAFWYWLGEILEWLFVALALVAIGCLLVYGLNDSDTHIPSAVAWVLVGSIAPLPVVWWLIGVVDRKGRGRAS